MSSNYKYLISYDQITLYSLNNLLSVKIAKKGYEAVFRMKKNIDLIMKYTSLPYPPIVVIPELKILIHDNSTLSMVYANINYRVMRGLFQPIVEISLPFLLYASNELMNLVLAHEFLHYMYLAIRYISSDYLVNPLIYTGSIMGRKFLEDVYYVDPSKVFNNTRFVKKMAKINEILEESKIADIIKKRWIDNNYPSKSIFADDFRIRLNINMWSNMHFPEEIKRKAKEIMDGSKTGAT
ncbi:MAG: hypothetical protein QXH96_00330 [Candidatus Geothermarchaeota archaeon]